MGSIHSAQVGVYSSMAKDNQDMNHEVLLAHLRYLVAQLDRHAQTLTQHVDPGITNVSPRSCVPSRATSERSCRRHPRTGARRIPDQSQ